MNPISAGEIGRETVNMSPLFWLKKILGYDQPDER